MYLNRDVWAVDVGKLCVSACVLMCTSAYLKNYNYKVINNCYTTDDQLVSLPPKRKHVHWYTTLPLRIDMGEEEPKLKRSRKQIYLSVHVRLFHHHWKWPNGMSHPCVFVCMSSGFHIRLSYGRMNLLLAMIRSIVRGEGDGRWKEIHPILSVAKTMFSYQITQKVKTTVTPVGGNTIERCDMAITI